MAEGLGRYHPERSRVEIRGMLARTARHVDNRTMNGPSRATRPRALRPRALRPGSRVALVAPAGPVDEERIEVAQERCRALGLEPVVYPGARARDRYLAGPDALRLDDLQCAFDAPDVDAVWALRGGYGTLRILDALDLSRQRRDPIPFIGFSDNTSIHVRHAAAGVVSFHGPHAGGPFPEGTEEAFRQVLFRPEAPGLLPPSPGDPEPRSLGPGRVSGPLVGGNLAILAALCGTRHSLDARGCILFLEDVAEPAYRVDRMLNQLRASGVLDGVLGLAFGRFTPVPEGEPHDVADVLAETASRLGVPAVMELPFGHVDHNCTLPVGATALLDGEAAELVLTEAAVR